MARFLFASIPVPAHTSNPLPIAARLVERGHEVVWYAGARLPRAHRRHRRPPGAATPRPTTSPAATSSTTSPSSPAGAAPG